MISSAAFQLGTDSIYRIDNRELVSQESSPLVKTLSKSVAMIFNSDDLITENNQLIIFANLLLEPPPIGINICPNERFANHHAYRAACSGFLVGPDLLVSAGHCFESQFSCDNQLIAFDLDADSEVSRGFTTDERNIYRCKEVIAHIYDEDRLQDYAVVRLDRKSDRMPLQLRTRGKISKKDKVFLIGHPLGLPLVYSAPAELVKNMNPRFFKARINSFHGNSGSPVFNAKTHLVEGILVRGEEDLETNEDGQCQKYIKYSPDKEVDKLKGESVTRIKFILPFL
jgi:hypothetical protein